MRFTRIMNRDLAMSLRRLFLWVLWKYARRLLLFVAHIISRVPGHIGLVTKFQRLQPCFRGPAVQWCCHRKSRYTGNRYGSHPNRNLPNINLHVSSCPMCSDSVTDGLDCRHIYFRITRLAVTPLTLHWTTAPWKHGISSVGVLCAQIMLLPKSNLVHFILKIWHLVATVLIIFLRINCRNFVQFK